MTVQITVETLIRAPIDRVWQAWTTPEDIMQWNAASDDWHTTASKVDLRPGGQFSSRMEARDGSQGFDFTGTYTAVDPRRLLECDMGGRVLRVEFTELDGAVRVRETFDADGSHPAEVQQDGWQAILDRFARHVEGSAGAV